MKARTVLLTISFVFLVSGCGPTAVDSSVSAPGAEESATNDIFADSQETLLTSPHQASIASTAIEDANDEPVAPGAIANCQLSLQLPPTIDKKTQGYAKIQIKNLGDDPITLVMPGDGSFSHARTPTIAWSMLSQDSKENHPQAPPTSRGGWCGNINSLKASELFELNPGESRELNEWVRFPVGPPGKYRVVFYYTNVPELKWSGIPIGVHNKDAMRRLRGSNPVAAVSNEVELEILQ